MLTVFRIQGKFVISCDIGTVKRKPCIFWIDKKTFLIRKVEEECIFINGGFRTKTTTTYFPVINADISKKALEFNPPRGSKPLKKIQVAKKTPRIKKGATRIFMKRLLFIG